MDSPDYSDSDSDSSSSSSADCSAPPSLVPKSTDLGKNVLFYSGNDKKEKYGVLRFVGETEFSEGVWCGVQLDGPTGKNNGSVHGIRYFTCEPNCGVFVPISKVQLDTSRRSRSRPNSQPGSRATSVERKVAPAPHGGRPATAKASLGGGHTPAVNKLGFGMQQELVNRLSQPLRRSSHPANAPNNRRQPMKAFATKGVGREEVREEKKVLAPFRAGGMYKAASSENIRAMKDKEKTKSGQKLSSSQGMPAKKSSSERDLRNAGKTGPTPSAGGGGVATLVKTGGGGGSSDGGGPKGKRKQVRTSSCSDILDSNAGIGPTPSSSAKSSTTSSNSHTSLDGYPWPRTSTPGNRDDLTPDGCSSPEESEGVSDAADKGFLDTPQHLGSSGAKTPPIVVQDEEEGEADTLANHVKRFAENQVQSTGPLLDQSVQSPDPNHAHKYFKNGSSGAATLTHPLTSSVYTGGSPKLLQRLLSPSTSSDSLESVSLREVAQLFQQQESHWKTIVGDLEGKLEAERAKSHRLQEELSRANQRPKEARYQRPGKHSEV